MDSVGFVASILLVLLVIAVTIDIAVKKLKKNWYSKYKEDIRLACGKSISETEVKKMISLSESNPKTLSIISACEIKDVDLNRVLLEAKHSSAHFSGLLTALIIKTKKSFPFFYVYSTSSDFDAYDTNTTDQFTLNLGGEMIRVATQKGAGIEVHQMMEKTSNLIKLIQALSETGIDIEFSNGNIYIWDYFNDKNLVREDQFSKLKHVADLTEKYLAPKLESLSDDFSQVAKVFNKD